MLIKKFSDEKFRGVLVKIIQASFRNGHVLTNIELDYLCKYKEDIITLWTTKFVKMK